MREELEEVLWAHLSAEISPEVQKHQIEQQVATSHVQPLTANDFSGVLCGAIHNRETSQVYVMLHACSTSI